MCEILLTRGNKRGLTFSSTDYRRARDANPDGAGYIILQKEKTGQRWEMKEMETFPEKKSAYTYTTAPGWQSWEDEYPGDWYDKANGANALALRTGSYATATPDTIPGEFYDKSADLKPGQIMVAHFRLATSGGIATHNTHPIVVGDYCVIHNGIFGYVGMRPGASDTRHFAELLQAGAKKKKLTHYAQEQKLIERLLKEAGGYYSIFVYSWKTGKLYYYKSAEASFQYDSTGLLGATRAERFPIITRKAKSGGFLISPQNMTAYNRV